MYILQALFTKFEFDITTAINGHQAYETIADSLANPDESIKNNYHQMFDLIVLDLNMPISDGFESCKNILKLYKQGNLFKINKGSSVSDQAINHTSNSNSQSVKIGSNSGQRSS